MQAVKRRTWYLLGLTLSIFVIVLVAAMLLSRSSVRTETTSIDNLYTPTLSGNLCNSQDASTLFTASAEGFSAQFPCTPKHGTTDVMMPIGNIPIVYYVADVNSTRYEVMIADYSAVFGGDLTNILRSIVLDRTKASTIDEFELKEKSSKAITENNVSGEFIRAENRINAARIKLLLIGKTLYRVTVRGPLDEIDQDRNSAFLDSFSLSVSH
jgi:hypothetical protein